MAYLFFIIQKEGLHNICTQYMHTIYAMNWQFRMKSKKMMRHVQSESMPTAADVLYKEADEIDRFATILYEEAEKNYQQVKELKESADAMMKLYRQRQREAASIRAKAEKHRPTTGKVPSQYENLSRLKKYRQGNSPPYAANSCPRGMRKLGNDGRVYWAIPNKNGINTWRLASPTKKQLGFKRI